MGRPRLIETKKARLDRKIPKERERWEEKQYIVRETHGQIDREGDIGRREK